MHEALLQTKKLTKKYGRYTALENADVTVFKGDIYGLIGRNGAGKTTLMKIITGLTGATSGSFQLFGKKGSGSDRKRIGCLIEDPAFFRDLTVRQNLKYYCLQKGITDLRQIDNALASVNMTEAANKKFKTLSLGMKQRTGIAFAIMDDPDLLILDEPINGLDPIGISELRETFHRLNTEKNVTMIISSHILSELYSVANRFLFIDKGRILREMTKEQLDSECMRCTVIKTNDARRAAAVIEEKFGITDYKVIDSSVLRIYDENIPSEKLSRTLIMNGAEISSVYSSGISLEDYFKSLVKEGN